MPAEKRFDLAIAGELNMDLILYGLPLDLQPERDLLAGAFVSTLGSSSAIVAHNAAALGLRVCFQSLIGDDDLGRIALSRLQEAKVDVSGVVVNPATATGVTVLLPHGHVRHSLTFLGSIAELSVPMLGLDVLRQARHFHLSSLFLQRALHPGLVPLLRDLKNAGLSISLDTNDDPSNQWGPPLADILPFVDLFMPNEDELCRMAGGVSLDHALDSFAIDVPAIIVKRGRHGCRIRDRKNIFDLPGLFVTPVDSIGAGDSFDAGFLFAYLNGHDLPSCAVAGNITGALSTQRAGGTEAFRDSVLREAFFRSHGFLQTG